MQPDLLGGLTPPSGTAGKNSRGRPKGAKNKAAGDLLKYISHQTGGVTPGQQLADLVMVTPRDVRLGRQAWLAEGKDLKGISKIQIGYWHRRKSLMALFNWTEDKADAVMAKLQDMLLPYVHQKQGSIEAEPIDKRTSIYVDGTELGALGNPTQALDLDGEISFGPMPAQPALTHGGSHMNTQTVKR